MTNQKHTNAPKRTLENTQNRWSELTIPSSFMFTPAIFRTTQMSKKMISMFGSVHTFVILATFLVNEFRFASCSMWTHQKSFRSKQLLSATIKTKMLVDQGPFNHVRYDTIGDEIVIVIHHPNEEMFLHFQEYGFSILLNGTR